MSINPWIHRSFFCLILVTIVSCQETSSENKSNPTKTSDAGRSDSRFLLNKATLEQANEQGQILWQIQAQNAVYTRERQIAQIEKLNGNLFQDGKIVLQISAEKGEVQQDGKKVTLKEKIIATDPRNGIVIKTDALEWYPEQDLLLIKDKIDSSHPKMKMTAKEGEYFTRNQKLELKGNIIATGIEPPLQLKTEHLTWEIKADKIFSNTPCQLARYQGNTIIDRVLAKKGEIDLAKNLALLEGNVILQSLNPALQMATNAVTWNYGERQVYSQQPTKLLHQEEKVTITANQFEVDFVKGLVKAKNRVNGISERNQAKIYAQSLTWDLNTQIINATEQVSYSQINPQVNLTGPQAEGKLQDNSIVVRGYKNKQVITKIIP